MSALDLFCAPEGAHTAPPHDLTSPGSPESPEMASAPVLVGEFRLGDINFTDLCIVFALGAIAGIGTSILAFVALQVVLGWFS